MSGLLVVRHAQSVWNAAGLWQGWADPPLSEEGVQQARQAAGQLAGDLPFDLVVSSDLIRARRTAELMAQALDVAAPLLIEAGLREFDVGEWSGCTREEIEARWPEAIERFGLGQMAAPPGGEDRDRFDARVAAASRRVGASAEATGARRVLVVSHGGVVRALARAVGQAEYRVGHLAGYWGWHTAAGLFPSERVDLLDGAVVADAGEAAAGSGL